jgi:hypothetical protein
MQHSIYFLTSVGRGEPPSRERENGSSYQYINPELPLIGLNFSLVKVMPMSESVQPYTKI